MTATATDASSPTFSGSASASARTSTRSTSCLSQFCFDVAHTYMLCPRPYPINFGTALDLSLNLFWIGWEVCTTVEVHDIYRMEVEVFLSLGWVLFYLAAVVVFGTTRALVGRKWCWRPAWAPPSSTRPRPSTSVAS